MKAKDVIKGIEEGFDDNKQIADAVAWIAELTADHDALKKDHKLLGHKLVCCHVAAKHPDPMLSRTGAYIEKWDSQSAEAARELRDERDALQAELAALKAERDQLSKACDQRAAHEYKLMGEVAALKAAQEWRGMESAPRDGSAVLLLVKGGDYPLADSSVWETIGNFGVGSDAAAWNFAGWDWVHDYYCMGNGDVIGWLPFPHPTTGAKP